MSDLENRTLSSPKKLNQAAEVMATLQGGGKSRCTLPVL